jgi:hypothetical protein
MDGSHPFTAPTQALRGYRCRDCKTVTHLSDLNGDMLCEDCGEAESDPEYEAPTGVELWVSERTW